MNIRHRAQTCGKKQANCGSSSLWFIGSAKENDGRQRCLMTQPCRKWVSASIGRIEMERMRSAETHLLRIDLPALPGLTLYLKDETTHLTGSLKHRLARSLFLYALCNGRIGPESTLVEASSGSTAVSEAYFARLLGLPFVAVMPRSTSAEKVQIIRAHGASCHLVEDPVRINEEAE